MDIQHNRLVRDLNMTINEGEDTAEEMLVEKKKSELINEQDEEAMLREILDKSPHNQQVHQSESEPSQQPRPPVRARPSPLETKKRGKSRERQQEKSSKVKKFV